MFEGEKEFFSCKELDSKLFAVEGGEFSGKSSVCELLKNDYKVVRLPGASEIGEKVRVLLKDRTIERHPHTDYFLLCACDAEFSHKDRTLIKGKILLDRSFLSRIVYQGVMGVTPFEKIFSDLKFCWDKIPCKTAVLTCSTETLLKRIAVSKREHDEWFDVLAEVTNNAYKELLEDPMPGVREICTDGLTIEQVAEKVKNYFEENW